MAAKLHSIFIVDSKNQYLSRFKKLLQNLPHLFYFCSTINEAQSIMSGVSPDIVICRAEPEDQSAKDFMDGVRKSFPGAIRIVFSREYNSVELSKMVVSGMVHRYISLIWKKEDVARILQRDLLTRTRLRMSNCRDFFEEISIIPVLPPVFLEIQEELRNPDCSIKELVAIIERDPIICIRLLQVVNSAAFTQNNTILDIHHAITFLGLDQIRELILFIYAMQVFPPYGECYELAVNLAIHSQMCGRLAGEIARAIEPKNELYAATAALLHDLGKLVLYSSGCQKLRASISAREAFDFSSSQFEKSTFNITHVELGGFLMLLWNLPMAIIEATVNHTLPLNKLWGVPLCVAIADRCLIEAQSQDTIQTDLETLSKKYPLNQWRDYAERIIEDEKSIDFLIPAKR